MLLCSFQEWFQNKIYRLGPPPFPPPFGQPCSRTNRSRCRTACDVCFQQRNYIIAATRGKLIKDAHKTVQIVDLNTARKCANARRQKAFLQPSKQAFSFFF